MKVRIKIGKKIYNGVLHSDDTSYGNTLFFRYGAEMSLALALYRFTLDAVGADWMVCSGFNRQGRYTQWFISNAEQNGEARNDF